MTTINKYQLYCSTENLYRCVWSNTVPTVCPNGGAHSVTNGSQFITQTKKARTITISESPHFAHNDYLQCDTTGGNISIHLPDATISYNGVIYIEKTAGTNSVNVYNNRDAAVIFTITTSNVTYRFQSNGTIWSQQIDNITDFNLSTNETDIESLYSFKNIPSIFEKGGLLTSDGKGLINHMPDTDGKVLTLDSTTNNGLKWQTDIKFTSLTTMRNHRTNSGTWETQFSFVFPGSNKVKIRAIKSVARINNAAIAYHMRLYNVDDNQVIAENQYSNTSFQIKDLTPLANLPVTDKLVEFQMFVDFGRTFLRNLYIEYE